MSNRQYHASRNPKITFRICQTIVESIYYVCQYTDDFILYTTGKNIPECVEKIQDALNTFNKILEDLGLIISVNKTKYCIFNKGRRQQQASLTINNNPLGDVVTVKYLGLWLDKSLRWNKQIIEIEKALRYINILKILASSS